MGFLPADKIGSQADMLANSITATATTFAVTTGQGNAKFPQGGFYVLLGANAVKPEVVHVSGRAADTFTMDQRGLSGANSQAAWPAGTSVQMVYPANTDDLFAHVSYLSDMIAYLTQGGVANAATTTTAVAASGTTIPTLGIAISRCTVASAASAAILQAGVRDGQTVIVENQSAANTITFATAATSHVADGASDVIAVLTSTMYEWNAAGSLWYKVN